MELFTRRLNRGQLIALDCLVAWGFTLVFMTGVASADVPAWARLAVPLGLGIPLAVRRIWPRTVFLAVFAFAVAASAFAVVAVPFAAPAYALYVVALNSGRRLPVNVIGLVSVFAVVALALAGVPGGLPRQFADVVVAVAALGGAWTAGRAVQERRAFAERRAQQAVTDERLRIARELHDVVAHSVGLIAVKAGVANHVMASRPEEARDALRVIETASRSAMVEMRHLLGVLRSADAPDLGPAPGLDGLPELAERARLGGVEVELEVEDAEGVPEGVGLSAYRIVQEALTNVVKHAAPARCRVSVVAAGGAVRIRVTDDGPGRRTLPHTGSGHGLIGMRERVMMYGGAFEAGPGPRGFQVTATLPFREIS